MPLVRGAGARAHCGRTQGVGGYVFSLAFAQVSRRWERSLAVVAAIVFAAVSFSLLTSAVATSQLRVRGTVAGNFRAAYDVLVRPAGSRTPLEESGRLVRENFLSGIFGGVSMAQYRDVARMDGVEVAAPVAMIGYVLPSLYLPIKLNDVVSGESQQVFRIGMTSVADRGLSQYPWAETYMYVTSQAFRGGYKSQLDPTTGRRIRVCASFASLPSVAKRSAFDLGAVQLLCHSTTTPAGYQSGLGLQRGDIGTWVQYPYPLLLAAIDPAAEAELVDLDEAVVDGRYLRASDPVRTKAAAPNNPDSLQYKQVPVIMADRTLVDEQLRVDIEKLTAGEAEKLPGRLASKSAPSWLASLDGERVKTTIMDSNSLYPQLLRRYRSPDVYQVPAQYWSTGQVDYSSAAESGRLVPVPRRNSVFTYTDPAIGFNAPQANADVGFRKLTLHAASNYITGNVLRAPILRAVGSFNPGEITGFSPLSRVPLTTYAAPSAAPGDPRTATLLDDQPLAPDNNLAGYLQQPPLLLTNLRSIPQFTATESFSSVTTADAPISVIRVRVAGVTGPDEVSQERVRLVAEQIAEQTGLDVDITIGSSPQPQLITLPAGDYGRPELTLQEGWTRKGVTTQLLSAIDRKSASLFGLVLGVCLMFLLNATTAAVRTRRSELAILSCLGWPARRIFALLQAELVTIGVAAGLAGTGLAFALVQVLDLPVNTARLLLITPVAVLLSVLAGLVPVWRACRATPLEASKPLVRPPRRAHRIDTITKLAMTAATRTPGRTMLGTLSLFAGVAALAVLLAIQQVFTDQAVGTLLGDAVAIQVRGVDYLAAGITIALGAFAVGDVAYLNIAERTNEIGTLRAAGWAEHHLKRLFATEGALIAALGAVTGAITGAGTVAALLPLDIATVLTTAGLAAAIGLGAASLALFTPVYRLSKLAPATAITTE